MNIHRIFKNILETPEVDFWASTYREYFFDVATTSQNVRFRVENYDPTDFELAIRETDNGNAYLIVYHCDEDALKLDERGVVDFGVFQIVVTKRRNDYMGTLLVDSRNTGRWECRKNIDELIGVLALVYSDSLFLAGE